MTTNLPESPEQLSPEQRALVALRQMRAKLDAVERARTEPLAIVGMSCCVPAARHPDAFWELLRDGRDAITEVPAERWKVDAWYDPDPAARGKTATRWGGFIDDADQFDPAFFGISPREAVHMDPQQRLFLKVAWEALESAGQTVAGLSGSKTGVFVGIHNHSSDYAFLQLAAPERIDAYTGTGTAHNVVSGRLSYTFDLRGPSVSVDTACSSSLVALHLACQSLRSRECDMAIAGGVNLMLSPEVTICFSRWGMLSPTGRCKAFDASADGFVRGEGCGAVVLKRLSDALASGDPILALIRGSAINQDGHTNGLTAPSGVSQQAVIQRALQSAGVPPERISYVEAHGTGTALGDPIELEALAEVYGKPRAQGGACMVGSVKANIGHLEGAAGIAGLIKVVLALKHEVIPPQVHFKALNPGIHLQGTSLQIASEPVAWKTASGERYAALSSFGWSGTNAHVILSEAPARPQRPEGARSSYYLLTLSAKAEGALRQGAGRLAEHIARAGDAALPDICHTLHQRRSHFAHRLAAVVASAAEARATLASFASGEPTQGALSGYLESGSQGEVAFLFSGQGAQYRGMGRGLYATQPVFREVLDRCDALLRPLLPATLLSVLDPGDGAASPLDETLYTQPALFALEVALAAMWQSWGIRPAAVLGHSVGEYAAACVAGVFSLEDGLTLIAARARAMQALPRGGAMAALFTSEERVARALDVAGRARALSIAALNGPTETVISGDADAVTAVEDELKAEGVKTQRLTVSHAFHSARMEPMLADFERTASQVRYAAPRIPLISNLTGKVMEMAPDAGYFCRHLRQPVRFAAGVSTLRERGLALFVEIGPKPVLLAMAGRCLPAEESERRALLPSLRKGKDDLQTMLESLGALYVRGATVDFAALDQGAVGAPTPLPPYAFQEKRFWIERASDAPAAGSHGHRTLQGEAIRSPALEGTLVRLSVSPSSPAFLSDHRVHGRAVLPATAYLEVALSAAATALGPFTYALCDLVFQEAMVLAEEGTHEVQVVVKPMADGKAPFQIWSRPEGAEAPFRLHASGSVVDTRGEPVAKAPFREAVAALPEALEPGSFYLDLAARGLDYGPSFQGVQELRFRDGEAAAYVALPEIAGGDDGYRAHPALLDACLHPLLAALSRPSTQAQGAGVYLPIAIDRFTLFARPAGRLLSYARLRPTSAASGAEVVTGDVHLFDEGGSLVAAVDGLHLKRAAGDALRVGGAFQDLLYDVAWQPKLRPEPQKAAGERGSWVVLMDARGVGKGVAALLVEQGERCVTVSPGARFARSGSDEFQIDPHDPEQVRRLFEEALDPALPPLRGVVYLWSLDSATELATAMLEATPAACGGLLHVVQALAHAEEKGAISSARLWVITQGAQPTSKEPGPVSVAQAAVWGLGRVVALEHPALWGGLIDIERGAPDAPSLLAELLTPDGEDQIALRRDGRYVARLARRASRAPAEPLVVHADGTYLVTGGLGGIGLEVARWLVAQGARHLVLCGRRGAADADPALRALEEQGARVVVRAADVSKEADVDRLLGEVRAELPPLRGVVHAAGLLDDGVLRKQSWERFEGVLAPKVRGAFFLHQKTAPLPLDFFVLFSSMFAVWGAPGQGSYAAANSALGALAHHRRSAGLPGLCIDWGAWAGKGMAGRMREQDLRRVAERGIRMLSPEQGLGVLDQLLRERATQASAFAVDWRAFFASLPEGRRPPLFSAFAPLPAQRAAADGNAAAPSLDWKTRLEKIRPQERRALLLEHVQATAARVLRVDLALLEDPRQPLSDLGLDSLLAVEMRDALCKSVGRPLPATLLFNYPTTLALAGYLDEEVLPAAAPPEAPAARRAEDRSRERGEVDVDALSGSELLTSFDQELAHIDQWMEDDPK